MLDFIYDLYKNDSFTVYLTIALVVLIILFIIVLIFGKRDKKLEETKKLQKIELDTFKEKEEKPTKIEVPAPQDESALTKDSTPTQESIKEENITKPVTEEIPMPVFTEADEDLVMDTSLIDNSDATIELPSLASESPEENEVNITTFEPDKPVIEDTPSLAAEDASLLNTFDEEGLVQDLKEISDLKDKINNIEIPTDSKEENKEIKENSYKVGPQIFSSVYVNKPDEPLLNIEPQEITEPVETSVIEPRISVPKFNTDVSPSFVNIETEEHHQEKEEQSDGNKLFFITDDDEEVELPSLK